MAWLHNIDLTFFFFPAYYIVYYTDAACKRSLRKFTRAHATQMIRCRTDAILESQDLFTSLGETVPSSSSHLLSQTTHYSKQMQAQLWNKAPLPCGTVPLYCYCPLQHCCSWVSLVVISYGGNFNFENVSTMVSDDNRYLHKNSCVPTHTHRQECSRTGQQS